MVPERMSGIYERRNFNRVHIPNMCVRRGKYVGELERGKKADAKYGIDEEEKGKIGKEIMRK